LFPLGSSKLSAEVSPSLVDWCNAMPVPAGIRDSACIKNEEEGNVEILCFHVGLHAFVGVANAILNLFEKRFD
jgi:hypothetical protein